jgi:hypothetical protein
MISECFIWATICHASIEVQPKVGWTGYHGASHVTKPAGSQFPGGDNMNSKLMFGAITETILKSGTSRKMRTKKLTNLATNRVTRVNNIIAKTIITIADK